MKKNRKSQPRLGHFDSIIEIDQNFDNCNFTNSYICEKV